MLRQDFESEVKRMIDRWGDAGKRHFNLQFNQVVWREFQYVELALFKDAVNFAVGEYRHPPVLSQLRSAIAAVRNEYYAKTKQDMTRDAQEFSDESQIDDIEVEMRMKFIKDRMAGKCPDQDWKVFCDTLEPASGKVQQNKGKER